MLKKKTRPTIKFKQKALFLDRDGIINKDKHYLHKISDVEFVKGIFSLCKKAISKGYILIVITNQAGVAKGLYTEKDVVELHNWMKDKFLKRKILISDFYYCPYHKKGTVLKYKRNSVFRKPNPGMILKAVKKWNIDISKSIMIGDRDSDRIKLKNLKTYLIKSEYLESDYDFSSLLDAQNKLFKK